jgi:hypothetical protein
MADQQKFPRVITTPLPPVTGRTNLASVTYPVILATETQRCVGKGNENGVLYEVPVPEKAAIDQFSILLTRKDSPIRSKHLPVFSRLNMIKCKKSTNEKDRRKLRTILENELKFAGIAFTGVEEGNGDGAPRMIASVIGGSHTVMSYNVNHETPLRPGSLVRWTLPKVTEHSNPVPPVRYHGASGRSVFAELEEVNPETTAEMMTNILENECLGADATKEFKNALDCTCPLKESCEKCLKKIKAVLKLNAMLQEREIGTVIHDNGQGSVDIRLK